MFIFAKNLKKLKFKPGTILSIFSFSLSLFVLGFYLIVMVHIANLIDIVNERTPFVIELKDNADSTSVYSLKESLDNLDYVFDVEYIPKEKGLQIMVEQFGQDIITDKEENPLKDLIKLKLKNSFIKQGKEKEFIDGIKQNSFVEDCIYEKESVESLKSNLSKLNSVFLILGIIFIVISFILIYNNLRFILHADRFMIKNMELIGASPSFIKRPYLKLALKIGFYSALISIFLLIMILVFFNLRYDIFNVILDIKLVALILVLMFVTSIILPPVFINYLVNRYLRLTDKHLYS